MRRTLFAIACLLSFGVHAGFTAATLLEDGGRLTLTASNGKHSEAPRLPDQVAFSTPIALKLVVLDETGGMHTFEGEQLAIFDWCFPSGPPGAASVAFRQGVLHGTDAQHFERRRIADGRLLARHDYPHDERANASARKRAPAWVRCVPE